MEDKGYDHPIYSLDLVNKGLPGQDDPRFGIEVPQGRLVTRRELRIRGAKQRSAVMDAALDMALRVHGLHVAGFARYGLSAAWADNLAYWRERLSMEDTSHDGVLTEGQLGTERLSSLQGRAAALWAHAAFCARLGGLGDVVSGRVPRGRLALLDGLQQLVERASARRDDLSRYGFLPEQLEELKAVTTALSQEHRQAGDRQWARRGHGAAISVLRGALLGDLSRLSLTAPRVISPGEAAALQMQRLLGQAAAAGRRQRRKA